MSIADPLDRMVEADRRIERINEALRIVVNGDLMVSAHALLMIDSPETEADVDYLLGLGMVPRRYDGSPRYGVLTHPLLLSSLEGELLDYALSQSEPAAA